MQILKYPLKGMNTLEIQKVKMVFGSKIISTGSQKGDVVVYALVPDKGSSVTIRFTIFSTGDDIDMSDKVYVGTIMFDKGNLVRHIFFDGNAAVIKIDG